MDLKKKKRILT